MALPGVRDLRPPRRALTCMGLRATAGWRLNAVVARSGLKFTTAACFGGRDLQNSSILRYRSDIWETGPHQEIEGLRENLKTFGSACRSDPDRRDDLRRRDRPQQRSAAGEVTLPLLPSRQAASSASDVGDTGDVLTDVGGTGSNSTLTTFVNRGVGLATAVPEASTWAARGHLRRFRLERAEPIRA